MRKPHEARHTSIVDSFGVPAAGERIAKDADKQNPHGVLWADLSTHTRRFAPTSPGGRGGAPSPSGRGRPEAPGVGAEVGPQDSMRVLLVRIFRDTLTGRWYAEGIYD